MFVIKDAGVREVQPAVEPDSCDRFPQPVSAFSASGAPACFWEASGGQPHAESSRVELFPEDWQSAHQLLKSLPGVLEIQTYGEALHIFVDSTAKRLPEIKNALEDHGLVYHGARSAPARMEQAFISLIRKIERIQE